MTRNPYRPRHPYGPRHHWTEETDADGRTTWRRYAWDAKDLDAVLALVTDDFGFEWYSSGKVMDKAQWLGAIFLLTPPVIIVAHVTGMLHQLAGVVACASAAASATLVRFQKHGTSARSRGEGRIFALATRRI